MKRILKRQNKQWHTAFAQALQAELSNYLDALEFIPEYLLVKAPQRIDVLVIKTKPGTVIKKSIAEVFRLHNIVEYKSPSEEPTRSSFYKTLGYCFSYAEKNDIPVSDMSMTFVSSMFPSGMIADIKPEYEVDKIEAGIYNIGGCSFPARLLVLSELPSGSNRLITGLLPKLPLHELQAVFDEAARRQELVRLDAFIETVNDVNIETVEEMDMIGLYRKVVREAESVGEARGEARGETRGETKAKIEYVLKVLQSRFKKVPKSIEKSVRSCTDLIVLDSLLVSAATCGTPDEFKQSIVK
ncbi:hypothetical protein FACS189427_05290 [Planctomycetales bacterium]|nr:hypothetical protein FACS189427_05290 [Planctomycetales bacterium]